MTQSRVTTTSRRGFLGASSSTAGLLLLKPETVFGTQANSTVEVGIIDRPPGVDPPGRDPARPVDVPFENPPDLIGFINGGHRRIVRPGQKKKAGFATVWQ